MNRAFLCLPLLLTASTLCILDAQDQVGNRVIWIGSRVYALKIPATPNAAFTASEELETHEVRTDGTDPRQGTATMKLVDITKDEPDPDLFQIPSDYRLLTNTTTSR